jgi:ATP-dependent exoDNAse (exonuclease V) beta subunit
MLMTTSGLFKVIRASAGSGKTYNLVKEYILLALQNDQPWYYKHILAITFTNAAAAEMKERVIARLKEFSKPDHHSDLFTEIASSLGVDNDTLRQRAAATFAHILHHYGQLSILTIDSFTHKLIRSFAKDLHLRHDFSIEMETQVFLESVVDFCIEQIGKDETLTSYLENFSLQNLENEKGWNVRHELIAIAKHLLAEDSRQPLLELEKFSLEDFNLLGKNLISKIKSQENSWKQKASLLVETIEQNGLSLNEFSYGKAGGLSFPYKIINDNFQFPGKRTHDLLTTTKWAAGKSDASVKSQIDTLQPKLHQLLEELVLDFSLEKFSHYELLKLIKRHLLSLGVLQRLHAFAQQLKIENNVLLIADFHRLVHEVVKDNEAPFIYERIGMRYKHLLIDEFQDTSILQWTNALPLIQNSLGENHMNLVVGDAKQAIYRWRGGDVSQFTDLPNLPHQAGVALPKDFLKYHFDDKNLKENYRSAQSIIQFNNTLYEHLAPACGSWQKVYHDHQQNSVRKEDGYVRVELSEAGTKDERWQRTSGLILSYIEECIADGYQPGEIAILTRRGMQEAGVVASMLMEHHYDVVTKESFLLEHSASVRATIASLSIHENTSKQIAIVELIKALEEIHSDISFEVFAEKYIHHDKKNVFIEFDKFILEHFKTSDLKIQSDGIFSLTMSLIRQYKIPMDAGLEFLLEKIKDQCIGRNVTLTTFLKWWKDNKEKLYIAATDNMNAIQIMTIHKSKGLQFPVVIYPRIASRDVQNDIWIKTDETAIGLPTALVPRKNIDFEKDPIQWPQEFSTEEEKVHLDELNTTYVATTRAEDRMYIIQEKPCSKWISKTLLETFNNQFDGFAELGVWENGTKEKHVKKQLVNISQLIHFGGEKFLQPQLRILSAQQEQNESRDYGTQLHACLAEIATKEDISNAIEKMTSAFAINDDSLREKISHDLHEILSHSKTAHWFSPGLSLLIEREICLENGTFIRPDRTIIYEDHIDILDFKTGTYDVKHLKQVEQYIAKTREVFQLPVNGYLLYTQPIEVVAVH